VNYGQGCCSCDNYLRAVVTLPELLAVALTANALDLLEAWCDRAPVGDHRRYVITREYDGAAYVELGERRTAGSANRWQWRSVTSLRDAAAKAIQIAASEGHP
jgi:hypothetical protein